VRGVHDLFTRRMIQLAEGYDRVTERQERPRIKLVRAA
jgi:hypothetical protein